MKKNKYVAFACVVLMGTFLTACSQSASTGGQAGTEQEVTTDLFANNGVLEINPTVTITIENYGDVVVELYPEKAPNTVNNFLTLAESGYYDGLTFHRIIEGFMIQGGDPEGTGSGGPGYAIAGEFINNGFEANDIAHVKGVISMARSMANDSAGSQFFIVSADSPHLDANYTGFGAVISGIEYIEQIEKVETGLADKPDEEIVITKMTVDMKGQEIPEVVKIEY